MGEGPLRIVYILGGPIFNGLVVAPICGILVSTVLTPVVIPLLYITLLRWKAGREEGIAA